MNFDKTIIEQLRQELKKPLPGEKAQYRMAPSYRPNLTKEQIEKLNPKLSGVLVLLYEKNGLLNIVFTKRKQYAGVHSGQISFPGGKKDDTDFDLTETALREAKEEIGIDEEKIEIIGKLSELFIPPSNFLVYPSVGFADSLLKFKPQVNEVEEVIEIPAQFFLDKKNTNMNTEIKLFNDTLVRVPAYIYRGHVIWGATAIMLSEFSFILGKLS